MRFAICCLTALSWLALAACSPQSVDNSGAAQPAVEKGQGQHALSGLDVIPLTILREGAVHQFRVEVARSDEEQARGLMFRTEMGPDEGMIFPREPASQASFWMKNTVIPLDIIFIGVDGRISNIEANAVPYSLAPHSSQGQAKAVLELNGGRAAELGIVPGNRVEW